MCGLSQDEIHINPIAISSFKVIEINRKLMRYVSQNKCATVCQKRASFLVVVGERAKRARHYQGCTNSS